MQVGFLGTGSMGIGMAGSLLRAGHRVRVWNRTRERARGLAAQGAELVDTPEEAIRAEAVVSMLADDAALHALFIDSGLLRHWAAGVPHVNMATVSSDCARTLAAAHRAVGVPYVAAPVFGRADVAAAGKLHILAAGESATLAQVQPLFEAMGQKTWPLGAQPERANIVKLAGNFMLASAIESLSEAITLGAGHGIAPAAMLEVLTGTLFSAPVFKNYGAAIVERRFEPAGFRLVLGLKDVRLALAAGEQAHVPMPIGSVLRDALLDACAQGDGEKDWVALSGVAFRRSGQP